MWTSLVRPLWTFPLMGCKVNSYCLQGKLQVMCMPLHTEPLCEQVIKSLSTLTTWILPQSA